MVSTAQTLTIAANAPNFYKCVCVNQDLPGCTFTLTINDNGDCAITDVSDDAAGPRVEKVFIDGVLYIQRGNELYTITGVRVR